MPPAKVKPHGYPTLSQIVEADLKPLRRGLVLVVGDLIADHYIWGQVERITPEAPVQVVRQADETWALGGAANVAHNVLTLGGKVKLVGVVGDDEEGRRLNEAIREAGIPVGGILRDKSRPTTRKTRVVSMAQQLLRLDRETARPVGRFMEDRLARSIERAAPSCGAIVLSDYAKGVLTPRVIRAALRAARRAKAPVFVDPKGHDYGRYRGADYLTPNQREAAQASAVAIGSDKDIARAGRKLIDQCRLQALIVTRGAEGFSIVPRAGSVRTVPARAREVYDVTGAGDTFMAGLALGVAAGMGLVDAAMMANEAAGIAVARVGMAAVSPMELLASLRGVGAGAKVRSLKELRMLLPSLRTRGRKIVFTNGCFDLLHAGHIRFLEEARRQGDVLVVGLNTDRSVRAVKGPRRPILCEAERAAVLSAIESVDYLVFYDEETPEPLLEALRPDILVKGRNVAPDQVVGREIVERYGGRVVRVPVMGGASTSGLIDSIIGKFDRES